MINQSEAQTPEVIVADKLRTDLSVNSRLTGETGASVTPGKRIPRKKRKIKSLTKFTARKDPILNQDKKL